MDMDRVMLLDVPHEIQIPIERDVRIVTALDQNLHSSERLGFLELGAMADEVRRRLHPDDIVTYIVDRNINYTNVCVADCKFCAFFACPAV